jgi:hypothetical protein
MATSTDKIYEITIPPSGVPGSKINVQLEDGRLFEVIIPAGSTPGQILNVGIPSAATGGTTAQADDAAPLAATSSSATRAEPKQYSGASKAIGVAAAAGVVTAVVVGSPVLGVVRHTVLTTYW